MLDARTYAGFGCSIVAGSGAVSAYLGWSASGEPFEAKKFLNGMVTGVLAGITLVFANLAAFKGISDDFAALALYGTIIGGAIGADMIRAKVTSMITSSDSTEPVPVVDVSKDAV